MSSQQESFSDTEKPTRTLNAFLSKKSRVPNKYERRLRRMVCQNGSKFERF